MRRDAKASSAETIEGSGSSRARFRRAPRAASLLALTVVALFSLASSPALANQTRFLSGTVGEGELSNPDGPVVDQANGNLYVADQGSGLVRKYDATGAPANFSALGTSALGPFTFNGGVAELAIDGSGGVNDGHLYVTDSRAEVPGVSAFDASGTGAAFSASASYISGNKLTGTPSGPYSNMCGVAVDANGAIYVGDYGDQGGRIDVYAASGKYLTQIPTPTVCNVAVDSKGNVYANQYFGAVDRFAPSIFPVTASTAYGAPTRVTSATSRGVVVDPANDHLFVNGDSFIAEYDSAANGSAAKGAFGAADLPGSTGVAVDRSGGVNEASIYAVTSGHVVRFGPAVITPGPTTGEATNLTFNGEARLNGTVDPSGVELTECAFEYGSDSSYGKTIPCSETPAEVGSGEGPVAVHADIAGNPVGEYHFRLAAANANGRETGADKIFFLGGIPSVLDQSVTPTYVEAELRALINPNGSITTYQFEYGPTAGYGSKTPLRTVAAGLKSLPVSEGITGLSPTSIYHYRVITSNIAGEVAGPDQTFTTAQYPEVGDPCPNAHIREVQRSSYLPECRAFEQVSPAEKNGVGVDRADTGFRAKPDGNAIVFGTDRRVLPGAYSGPNIPRSIAYRNADDWETKTLDVFGSNLYHLSDFFFSTVAVSPDLSRAIVFSNSKLTPEAQEGVSNLFISEPATGNLRFLATDSKFGALAGLNQNNVLFGASNDMETIVFTYGTDGQPMYEATVGKGVRLVSVAPDGTELNGQVLNVYAEDQHFISADGSRIFFSSKGTFPDGHFAGVYVRVNGEETIPISVSHMPGKPEEPNGPQALPGTFLWASLDGRYVEFRSEASVPLTPGAPAGEGVYRYDLETDTMTYLPNGDSNPDERRYANFMGPGKYGGAEDLYLHDYRNDTTVCVSCRPDHRPNVSAAGIPRGNAGQSTFNHWFSRTITDDGTVYFDTADPLVPRDSNGTRDVYSYHDGKLSLISGGELFTASQIQEVTPDGRDVFFITDQRLVGQDRDTQGDLYDARIDGGLPRQNPGPPLQCLRDDCKATPGAGPELPFGGSEGLSGPQNFKAPANKRCGKGRHKVRKRGKSRCVKQRKNRVNSNRRQAR